MIIKIVIKKKTIIKYNKKENNNKILFTNKILSINHENKANIISLKRYRKLRTSSTEYWQRLLTSVYSQDLA